MQKIVKKSRAKIPAYTGMHKQTFCLYLKEREFRYNHRDEKTYKKQLDKFKKDLCSSHPPWSKFLSICYG